jgi:hypothetical protein
VLERFGFRALFRKRVTTTRNASRRTAVGIKRARSVPQTRGNYERMFLST